MFLTNRFIHGCKNQFFGVNIGEESAGVSQPVTVEGGGPLFQRKLILISWLPESAKWHDCFAMEKNTAMLQRILILASVKPKKHPFFSPNFLRNAAETRNVLSSHYTSRNLRCWKQSKLLTFFGFKNLFFYLLRAQLMPT
jgi:hypothetical protein